MIVTFYSFKGGVGRSMALVNVGEILADRGYRVLMIDFDLEAPGLERYLEDPSSRGAGVKDLQARRGVMDLIHDYKETLCQSPSKERPGSEEEWVRQGEVWVPRPSSYAVRVSTTRKRSGELWLIPAGRRDGDHYDRYAERVRRFDWEAFYERWNGDLFMDLLCDELSMPGGRQAPFADIVLIDSRTGVTEHGGVCTHHLADMVVLLCAANQLNIEGTRWMAERLTRSDMRELRGGRRLRVLPVAARIEQKSQKNELVDFRRRFEKTFADFVPPEIEGSKLDPFAIDAEIAYTPYYAFQERVVARESESEREEGLYRSYQLLTDAIERCGKDGFDLLAPGSSDDDKTTRVARRLQVSHSVGGDAALEATELYLRWLCDRFRFLDLKGMGVSDRVPLRLPLSALFVPLTARLHGSEKKGEPASAAGELAGRSLAALTGDAGLRLRESQSVLELIDEHAGLVVLGDPGSGKTTLLKHLAVSLALGEGQDLGLGDRFPILAPLAGYARVRVESPDLSLEEFIVEHAAHETGEPWVVGAIRGAISAGRALVLLDGLDEVRETVLRREVARQVETFFERWCGRGNRLVVTSRVVGYREVFLSGDLAVCTLADFGDEEIGAFVRNWTVALERQAQGDTGAARSDAEAERRELLAAIRAGDSVRRLAANPLLLTILALMKRQGVTLPERRVELYEQYVRTLLSSWNRARSLGRIDGRELDVVETVRILARLALWMHERDPGLGLAPEEELRGQLGSFFEQEGESEPKKAAQTFLGDVAEYAGLLTERGPARYGFIHLTFEEYLAAVGIAHDAEGDVEAMYVAVTERVGDPVWREPILLLVGYVALVQQLPTIAGKLLERLVAERPGPPGTAVVLAGTALADLGSSRMAGKARSMVIEALVEALGHEQVPAKIRLEAGDVLGRLGDPRPGVGAVVHAGVELPAIEWHEVPAGPFPMGSAVEDTDAFEAEKPVHEVKLDRFWVARYPVTNAQYRAFVEAGGYDEEIWWTEVGWTWLKGKDEEPDLSWIEDEALRKRYRDWLAQRTPELRLRPWFWHHPRFSGANRPVIGVSWYEAQAFTVWLEAQRRDGAPIFRSSESPPAGYGVRLPSEAEWEKGARGPNGRRWPWGDGFGNHRGSTQETGLEEPSPVGLFPAGAGPFGTLDQAGNVWEWTRTLWSRGRVDEPGFAYPYDPDDGREALAGSGASIIRGGSWFNDSLSARCASRSQHLAISFDGNVGFRVVLSLADSDS